MPLSTSAQLWEKHGKHVRSNWAFMYMPYVCATPKVTSFTIFHEAVGGIRKHQSTHRTTIFITHCETAVEMCSNVCQVTSCFPTRPAQSVALVEVCS